MKRARANESAPNVFASVLLSFTLVSCPHSLSSSPPTTFSSGNPRSSTTEQMEIDINQDIDGRPPLHYAADFGQPHVIEYLVSKGADINAKDKHGISALLAAIWEGHTTCVRTLLDKGAEKTGSAPDGTNYLDCADKAEIKQLLQ